MNSGILAIGGYYSKGPTKIYPGVAVISVSSSGQWSSWSESKKSKRERNGFMATQVPFSFILELCHRESINI